MELPQTIYFVYGIIKKLQKQFYCKVVAAISENTTFLHQIYFSRHPCLNWFRTWNAFFRSIDVIFDHFWSTFGGIAATTLRKSKQKIHQ